MSRPSSSAAPSLPSSFAPSFLPRFALHPLALACALLAAHGAYAAAPVAPAAAQPDAQPAAAQPDETDAPIATVRVTGTTDKDSYTVRESSSATRMDLSLRETPQSVSVVTRTKLDDFKLNSVNEMLATVPGVTVEAVETDRIYYTARGFDITNFQYDGVGIPFVFGNVVGNFDTALYDQVDVVRGANGLMSSTGNPSATVNFIRKRPGDKFAASAGITYGSWGAKRLDADISVPLSTDWAARVVVARDQGSNGYLDRYEMKKTVASVMLQGKVTPNDKVAVGYSYQKVAADGSMYGALPLYYTDGSPTDYPSSASTAPGWASQNTAINSTFAEWTHRLGNDWTSKATVTYNFSPTTARLFFVSGVQDRDTGLGLTSYPTYYAYTFKQTLADWTVNGKFDLGGRRHDLSFGASWSQSKTREDEAYADGIGTDLPGNTAVDGSYPLPTFGADMQAGAYTDKRKNAFLAARWNLADDWKLLTGANVVDVETSGNSFGVDSYRSATKTTPYAGLVYDIDRHVSAYASYTSIFNPQSELDASRQTLAPMQGKTYELGLKSELFGGKLNLSGAVFKTKQTNTAQLEGYLNGVDAYYSGINAQSKGLELELNGQITRNWQASVGWTAMSMEGDGGADVKTYLPRHTLRSATTYRFDALPALKVGASANWQSKIYYDDVVAVIHQGSYATVGLMAQYDINPHLKLSANLNNVTNNKHYESLYWDQSYYAPPRNGSVSLNWTY